MITLRKANERGYSKLNWLESYHSFSFSDYFDPDHMGFSSLRVINEDLVVPDGGFPTHSHRDMEIITYVLSGKLEHKDSMGNTSIIEPGDTQRMSAGRGVTHSEYNASSYEPVHFLQIWITPSLISIEPSYEQKNIPSALKRGGLKLIASNDGSQDSVIIHQDVKIYTSLLDHGEEIEFSAHDDRSVYIHLAKGGINVNGNELTKGDGAKITNEATINIVCIDSAEFLLFDLP